MTKKDLKILLKDREAQHDYFERVLPKVQYKRLNWLIELELLLEKESNQ